MVVVLMVGLQPVELMVVRLMDGVPMVVIVRKRLVQFMVPVRAMPVVV
jgi:hypothetical protein